MGTEINLERSAVAVHYTRGTPVREIAAMIGGEFSSVPASLVRLFRDGTMTGVGESQLLERFLSQGDESAFEMILRRHGPMVLATCRRILSDPNDVEDAFQATFLILVRKGRSIRNHAVLGTWLHGVARRVAMRGQVNTRRRHAREHGGSEMTAWEDRRTVDNDAAEFRSILDEELTRLPERYRSALVLCDLEGQTHEQAAAQLRCPVGTVKSRLARARDRLRSRLARRGIASSAAILASALAPEPASAVTTEQLASTIGAAARFLANREVAAGAVSVAVATLVDGTLRSMSMSALKFAAAMVMAAGVIATGTGVLAYQEPKSKPAGNVLLLSRKPEGDTRSTADLAPGNPSRAVPVDASAKPGPNPNSSITALAQARYLAAATILEIERNAHKSNPDGPNLQPLYTWALRALEAQRDISDTKANQIDAFEKYRNVMNEAITHIKPEYKDLLQGADYHRLEAELWLAQARAGGEPKLPGSAPSGRPVTGAGARPGTDPKSQALLARLEESIPMKFPNPTPLEDVLRYIQSATAGANGVGIPIYVDPVDESEDENININDKLMKTPITMDLEGVPLRRILKLLAEQLGMGYGIKDGMVTMRPPAKGRNSWEELMVMEESFPQTSPLALEVARARRGELSTAELAQLNERLQAIEAVTKHWESIQRFGPGIHSPAPGGLNQGAPTSPANPNRPAR
jgi:RNA polymerase sigma factor (sigma-70 family)